MGETVRRTSTATTSRTAKPYVCQHPIIVFHTFFFVSCYTKHSKTHEKERVGNYDILFILLTNGSLFVKVEATKRHRRTETIMGQCLDLDGCGFHNREKARFCARCGIPL